MPDPEYDEKSYECPDEMRLQLGYRQSKDGYYTLFFTKSHSAHSVMVTTHVKQTTVIDNVGY